MNAEIALHWMREALQVGLTVAAPILAVALAVGLVVSLLQAVTSIQEMTLSYIPKMLAVGLVVLLLAPWMLQLLADFAASAFRFIPNVSH